MTDFDIIGFIGTAWLTCHGSMYYLCEVKPKVLQIVDIIRQDDEEEEVEYHKPVEVEYKRNELIV